jgi:hypothetical protein
VHETSAVVEMGTVPTPEGRVLVFPNNYQHCVAPITNTGKEVGLRKILCFFLVDPKVRIPSTLHIGEQNWDRLAARYMRYLQECTTLSKDTAQLVISYLQCGRRLPFHYLIDCHSLL